MLEYIGEGYGLPARGEVETITAMAHSEGLFFDVSYGGKALLGTLRQIAEVWSQKEQKDVFGRRRVVLLNTGGVFGLMAHGDRFDSLRFNLLRPSREESSSSSSYEGEE